MQNSGEADRTNTWVPLPEPGPPSTKTMLRCFFAGVLDPRSEMPPAVRSCSRHRSSNFTGLAVGLACHTCRYDVSTSVPAQSLQRERTGSFFAVSAPPAQCAAGDGAVAVAAAAAIRPTPSFHSCCCGCGCACGRIEIGCSSMQMSRSAMAASRGSQQP